MWLLEDIICRYTIVASILDPSTVTEYPQEEVLHVGGRILPRVVNTDPSLGSPRINGLAAFISKLIEEFTAEL